jgi:hypothetical protein
MATKKTAQPPVAEYKIPKAIADWVEQAEARMRYYTAKVDELQAENDRLRKANKVMEARVMGQSSE